MLKRRTDKPRKRRQTLTLNWLWFLVIWRKGWDSNSRDPCGPASFQDWCLKPLGHPSKIGLPNTPSLSANPQRNRRPRRGVTASREPRMCGVSRENATFPRSRLILLEIGSVLSQQMAAGGAVVSVTATRPQEWR